ncbi:MAG: MFS transporter [Acetobacteraceae bacterium]
MNLETRTIRRISWRIVPFIMICYFIAYLDRVNISFASLTMNKDLGISATAYGFGAGVFFISYFLFEVPSNMFLERVGARRWIARIMVSWGIVAGGMAFVGGETSFYVMRFLLGAAEAGFFPGIIFYLTLWFPEDYRGRIISAFMVAIPLSGMIGAPLSGYLLGLHGLAGFKDWQLLFLIQAAPAVILGICVFFYLTDRPAEAKWLPEDEKQWLIARLEREQQQISAPGHVGYLGILRTLSNPIVLKLAMVYFALAAMNYGFGFYAPQLLAVFGVSSQTIGELLIIPSAIGAVGMVLWGRHSDATQERRYHLAVAAACSIVGLVGAASATNIYLTMAFLSLVGFGVSAAVVFWTIPGGFLAGPQAAIGIAAISSIGQFAGFVSPYIIGYLKDATQSFSAGLIAVSIIGLIGIFVLLALIPVVRRAPAKVVVGH